MSELFAIILLSSLSTDIGYNEQPIIKNINYGILIIMMQFILINYKRKKYKLSLLDVILTNVFLVGLPLIRIMKKK